ncbi:C4-dicarboxylate ABC transporter [Leucobacter sp. OLJS4]|uniref:anaerobic C4-dicarboxylate transporter n=1 Tax=unclassified Leucobacter TaxID=2621730 RepID=UPI000C1904B7|nr:MULTISPECIES: anaerobic C4-dicarboxylate transporter family protein [unclassified Leucobacter]PII84069.1 C4-dicarboxylate ABC transporter [Leucobacter sp. OLCALW19]PII88317.1 C4-dicarboxylate ABC transporter [Leucobacter sp. OLTLW20]PII92316.1 C4-dicarboxylate ABC transporter [Leucobacter sp. OLAS13]PII99701.1 C4-dicarboxylate ABC transporter [Leucobacter sp. OLDS2]PIJ02959.1 C4-dicarboxylate ABC transporter [Leucobacter sp. OLIS6]
MDIALFIAQLVVVLGCIVMGTRSSGVGLGLWGGTGVAILVFGFRLAPGSPPVDALLIVLSVVLASSMMQAAGGIDWMVSIAAKLISRSPKQITLVAPLVSFLFSVGAGTSNILYPLLPVIQDLSYRNGIRPSRPLSLSVVATGVALACSPVSAAMAAMVTLTDTAPWNFELIDILKVTIPAAIVGIVLSSIAVNRLGKDIADDPEIQAKIAKGELEAPHADAQEVKAAVTVTAAGRNAALIFLLGVAAIVIFGLFKGLRPLDAEGAAISMTPVIEIVMFVVGTLILLVSRPKVAEIPTMTVFKAGMVSAIALFGLAWLTDTFLGAHTKLIAEGVGGLVTAAPWIFALGVFLVCVLTTSQSTATRTIVPIGLAAGIPLGLLSGMWAGAFAGIYLLPTNGSQIAAANFDTSGSTKLGTKLVDHAFFLPTLILAVTTIAAGALFGALWGG